MTTVDKVKFLKEERYQDLNAWEKEFISDLYDSAYSKNGQLSTTLAEAFDALTTRQIEKVNEIWEDAGL